MPHSDNPQAQPTPQGAQPQRSAEDMQTSTERSERMVKVHLDQQRMYRAKDSDTHAITVGPGDVEVPAWVAAEWGMEGEPVKAQSARASRRGATPEQELEAETGHDVEQTGTNPPTYVETDKPAPRQDAPKGKK